jgi:hypothetical protein
LIGAALIALPLTCFAQEQPPATPPSAQTEQAAAPANANQAVAKTHLTAARNTLSQVTQLPAAAQLQGDARTQVSQLINNFNELITTQANWKAAYAKVAANLESLLGPSPNDATRPSGTPGAVGTSGVAGMASLDPAIRAKLTEFRSQLDEFQKSAMGASSPAPSSAQASAPDPAATPAAPPATTAPTTSTTTTTSTETTTTPPAKAVEDPQTSESVNLNPQEALQHIEAIEVILGAQSSAQGAAQAAAGAVSTTTTPSGSTRTTITPSNITLTQAQIDELKNHLAELRRLIDKK